MEARKQKKAQTSIEFIFVFAMSILILIMVFFLVQNQIIDVSIQKEYADARNTLSDISIAVNDVYAQGADSSKTARIFLPSTYDSNGSGIINNSIVLIIRQTALVHTFSFPVNGTFPSAQGSYEILAYSNGSSVYVNWTI